MSKEIDERVVSMQFDNALFEKNIQKSLKSVDDLNKSLNNLDGAKGFDKLNDAAKKVDLSPIMDSAKEVEKSFSKMEIVSTGALLRIGSELTEFGIKIGKKFWSATIGQIQSGGWKRASDIKSGKFMLEGLGLTDSQVKDMTKAAQDAVTDTAAGLGEAMKAAGVLATSGLKDAEKMRETLRGIAGVSAMTGRSFENIANIYSTVASNGKLMTMQLRQFSAAGINVSAKLAEQMGTTEAAINDMVTKGQIDFETFADAMTSAFGDHAKDANKTFEGALANMKAALSRIGEHFATPLMDNLKDVFNNFRVFFNAVNKALEPVYKDFELLMKVGNKFIEKIFNPIIKKDDKGNLDTYSSAIDNIVAGIKNLYTTVILIFKTIADAFREVFPSLEDSSEGFKDLTQAIMPTKQGLELLKTVLIPVFEILRVVGTAIKYVITFASYFVRVIAAVVHSLTGLSGGLTEWMKQAREGKTLATALETAFDILAGAVTGLAMAIVGALTLIPKLIKKLGEFFKFDFNSIKQIGLNIINGIVSGLQAGFSVLQKVWTGIVNYIPDTISKLLKIKSPSRVMMAVGGNVVMGIVKGMSNNEGELDKEVTGVTDILSKIVSFGANIAESFGKMAYSAIEGLIGIFKKFTGKVDEANLKKTTATLVETKEVMNDIYMAGGGSSNSYQEVQRVGDDWVDTNEKVEKSTMSLKDRLSALYTGISDRIKQLGIDINGFKFIIAGFGVALVATMSKVAFSLNALSGFGKLIASLSVLAGAFMVFKNVDFGPAIEGIKKFFENIKMLVDNLDVVNKIKGFFGKIREIIEDTNMVMLAAKVIAFTFAIVIIKTVHNLAMLATSITSTVNNMASAIKSLANMKLGLYESTADKILKFAIALSSIVISISLLAKAFAENPDAMNAAVTSIAVIIGLFGLVTLLLSKILKMKDIAAGVQEAIKNLTYISWAMLALVMALVFMASQLDKVGWDVATETFVLFGAVLISFAAFVKTIDKVEANVSPALVISLAVMLLAIGQMMKGFGDAFSGAEDIHSVALAFTKMVAPVLAALMGVALIIRALQSVDKETKSTSTFGGLIGKIFGTSKSKDDKKAVDISSNAVKTLLAISALMITMGGLMKVFSTFSVDEMNTAIMGITVAITLIAGLCYVIRDTNADISTISAFARDVAIAVVALLAAIKLLSNMGDIDMDQIIDRLLWIVGIVGAAMIVIALATRILANGINEVVVSVKGLMITLVSLSVGLAALGAVFSLIPQDRLKMFMEWSTTLVGYILAAAFAISALGLILDTINSFSDDSDGAKNAKNTFLNMLGMLLGIGILLGSLVVLSVMDPESLLTPITAITLILLGLSLMFHQLSGIGDIQNAKVAFISMAYIITLLSGVLIALAVLPVEPSKVISIAGSLTAVLIGLAVLIGSVKALNDLKINKGVIKTLVFLTAIISLISLTMYALARTNVDWKTMTAIGGSMAASIGVLVGLVAVIQTLKNLTINKNTVETLRTLALLIAAIGIVFAIIAMTKADWTSIAAIGTSMFACIAILIGLVAVIRSLNKITVNKNTMHTIMTLAMVIGAIGIVFAILGALKVNWQELLAMGVMMVLTIGVLIGLVAVLKVLDGVNIGKGIIGLLGMMALVIISIGVTLGILTMILSAVDVTNILWAVAGIVLVLAAVTGMVAVLSLLSVNPGLIPMIGVLAGVIVALGVALAALALIGGENVMAAGIAMTVVLGVLTLLAGIIAIVPGATAAVGALSALITSIGILILSMGLSVAVVILSLGVAMGALTYGLKILETVDYHKIFEGLTEVTTAVIAFGTAVLGTALKTALGVAAIGVAASLLVTKLIPLMAAVGMFIMGGMALGITKNTKNVTKAMKAADDSIIAQSQKDLQWSSPSKVFRSIGNFLMDGFIMGIVDKIPLLGDTLHAALENIANWFNEKADALEQTGDDWGNAIKLGLSDVLGDFDFEIPNLTEMMEEATAGFNLEGDAADDTAASMDDYAASTENATEKTDSLKDSIARALDMFTEFDDTAYMTGKDVINSFKSQLEGVSKWSEELAALSARGLGEVIIEELANLGPQGYEKVHAFYTMTNTELSLMNIMYKQKLSLQNGTSKKIAKSFGKLTDDVSDTLEDGVDQMGENLTDAVTDMASGLMSTISKQLDYEKVIGQVAGFRDNIADKIRSSMSIFEAVGEQEKVKAKDLLKNMKDQVQHVGKWASMITEMAGKGFSEGLVATLTDMGPQSYSKVQAFLTMSESEIAEANRLYEASQNVPEYGADKIVKAFAQAGFTASMGLTDSFLEGLDPDAVSEALGDLANTSISTLVYELNNPVSAEELGESWAGDFAAGLEKGAEKVEEAAKKVAEAANIEESHELVDYGYKQTDYARVMDEVWKKRSKLAEGQQYRDENFESYVDDMSTRRIRRERQEQQEKLKDISGSRWANTKFADDTLKYKFIGDQEGDEYFNKIIRKSLDARRKIDPNAGYIDDYMEKFTNTVTYDLGKIMDDGIYNTLLNMANAGDEEAALMTKYFDHIITTGAKAADSDNVFKISKETALRWAEAYTDPEIISATEKGGSSMSNNVINGYTGNTSGGGSGTFKSMSRPQFIATPIGKEMLSLGGYTSSALGEGIETEGETVMTTAGENVAKSFIISLTDNLLSFLTGILDSDDEITSPKIKPVIDGSDITTGFKSLFSGKNLDLSASANLNMSYKDSNSKLLDAIKGNTNDDVVSSINQLIEQVNLLRNETSNLNVVMDTGRLVGQLLRPLDVGLGQNATYAGRGV